MSNRYIVPDGLVYSQQGLREMRLRLQIRAPPTPYTSQVEGLDNESPSHFHSLPYQGKAKSVFAWTLLNRISL